MGNAIITPSIPIILGSASKVRYEILKKTGIEFSVVISEIDEEKLKKNLLDKSISEIAVALASEKALSISKNYPNNYVIGADQICNLNNEMFSKPVTMDKAIEQLKKLSGKTHKQTSGICIYNNSELIWSYSEEAELTMHKLEKKEIIKYLEIDTPFNSCGSYKYESLGLHLFSKVIGQNETIQGFPITGLLEQLRKNKIYSLDTMRLN